jgi:hypothetical protein
MCEENTEILNENSVVIKPSSETEKLDFCVG